MEGERRVGKVKAVLMSPRHGYPTYPQESIEIGALGIPGDAHSGPLRESFKIPGTYKDNDRPICIVAQETYDEINKIFGLSATPGDFNEQVVVEGLGDLSRVEIGSRVSMGNVVIEIVDPAWPCIKLNKHLGEPMAAKRLVYKDENGENRSKRGILGRVLEEGVLTPGEDVMLFAPPA